jgi:SAM-dependent methyltransferase
MDRFNKEALDWDKNPDINLINDQVSNLILPEILKKSDSVLELGCGTGLLTFRAYLTVSEWFGIDTASGMIAMLDAKIPKHPGADSIVQAETMYLTEPTQLSKKYDWGVSAMTFHHIPDMQSTITCLVKCLTTGLLIIDYLEWDGSIVFHPPDKMDGVERHGLKAEELEQMCRTAGFKHVTSRIGFNLTLQRQGKGVDFPFLVVTATHSTA